MTSESLFYEDLAVGREWESGGRTVPAAAVRAFADLTGDRSPVHLDPEFARTTPFRRPIAHGLLGLGVAGGLTVGAPAVRTQAFLCLREWHFLAPVYPGDTLRVRNRVDAVRPRANGRRAEVTWRVQVVNQAGRVVQEGVTVTLVAGRGQAA